MAEQKNAVLELMLADMENAPPEYWPTKFWLHGLMMPTISQLL